MIISKPWVTEEIAFIFTIEPPHSSVAKDFTSENSFEMARTPVPISDCIKIKTT